MTNGLIVMAYGTPTGPEQVEEYYTHIRRGRPPEPAQLEDLRARYDAIGGISPLAQRTHAQLRAIGDALDEMVPGEWVLRLGQKHATPFIEDGVGELVDAGVERIVGLVLAPHYSEASVGQYHARARRPRPLQRTRSASPASTAGISNRRSSISRLPRWATP